MNDYWLFDTNCISQVLKVFRAGGEERIRTFLGNHKVVLCNLTFSELSASKDLWDILAEFCKSFECYVVNVENLEANELMNGSEAREPSLWFRPFRIFAELFPYMEERGKIPENPKIVKARMAENYLENLRDMIGKRLDEVPLSATIAVKLSQMQKDANIEPNISNVNPKFFPYFFTFMHIWHHKFSSNPRAAIETNDLYDMPIAAASSLCGAYFGEGSYVQILKQIKSSKIKSQYRVARLAKKVNPEFDMLAFEKLKPELDFEYPLLQNTLLLSYGELRNILEESGQDWKK